MLLPGRVWRTSWRSCYTVMGHGFAHLCFLLKDIYIFRTIDVNFIHFIVMLSQLKQITYEGGSESSVIGIITLL